MVHTSTFIIAGIALIVAQTLAAPVPPPEVKAEVKAEVKVEPGDPGPVHGVQFAHVKAEPQSPTAADPDVYRWRSISPRDVRPPVTEHLLANSGLPTTAGGRPETTGFTRVRRRPETTGIGFTPVPPQPNAPAIGHLPRPNSGPPTTVANRDVYHSRFDSPRGIERPPNADTDSDPGPRGPDLNWPPAEPTPVIPRPGIPFTQLPSPQHNEPPALRQFLR